MEELIKSKNFNKNTKKLNLQFNRLTEIKGLLTLTNLQELYLNDNNITEIKGLDKLSNLQELDLWSNKITEIKGLQLLTNLQKINICTNNITKINYFDISYHSYNYYGFDLDENKLNKAKIIKKYCKLLLQINAIRLIQRRYRLHILHPHHEYNIRTTKREMEKIMLEYKNK